MKTVERRVKRADVRAGREPWTEDEKKRTIREVMKAGELIVLTPELQAIREQVNAMAVKFGQALPDGAHIDDFDGHAMATFVDAQGSVEFTIRVFVRGEKP